jgi:hypothetical protein
LSIEYARAVRDQLELNISDEMLGEIVCRLAKWSSKEFDTLSLDGNDDPSKYLAILKLIGEHSE